MDELRTLEKVCKLIKKLSLQGFAVTKREAHRVEFLRNASGRYAWATQPLSRVAIYGMTFQQTYGDLEAALHLDREAKPAVILDKARKTSR